VPGTWVQPPRVGLLWTPGYWAVASGVYVFHAGYWGPHVGFYGGVNYGFGYVGTGFVGGRWVAGSFAYNQAVTNVNVTVIHNTYRETVVNNVTVNRVSYNGGEGGIRAMPSAQERIAEREPHTPPTVMQHQHIEAASNNPALFAKSNGGHPNVAATPRPGAFTGPGVVRAHGGGAAGLARHNGERPFAPNAAGHPQPANGAPPHQRNGQPALAPNAAAHTQPSNGQRPQQNTAQHPQQPANANGKPGAAKQKPHEPEQPNKKYQADLQR
jgi:hypothetical protein